MQFCVTPKKYSNNETNIDTCQYVIEEMNGCHFDLFFSCEHTYPLIYMPYSQSNTDYLWISRSQKILKIFY